MAMKGIPPAEEFPKIGTVANPAIFYDGSDLWLSYEIAPVSGGGVALLRFLDVADFQVSPLNTEGLHQGPYPARPWAFTEVIGAENTPHFMPFTCRFWTISFNDATVLVAFESVELRARTGEKISPARFLRGHLQDH